MPTGSLWVVGSWWEGDDAEQIEWTREVFDALTPHSTGGVYVNSLQDEPDAADPRCLQRLDLGAAGRGQGPLGPRQRLPAQLQRAALRPECARRRRRPRRGCGRRACASTRPTWCSAVLGLITSRSRYLGVRQAGGQQLEHLALAAGQLARGARCRAAGRAELAQQAGGLVGVAGRAEALEDRQAGARRLDRELRALCSANARASSTRVSPSSRGSSRRAKLSAACSSARTSGCSPARRAARARCSSATAVRSSRPSCVARRSSASAAARASSGRPRASSTAPRRANSGAL